MTIGDDPPPKSVNVPVINPGAVPCEEVAKLIVPPCELSVPLSMSEYGCPVRWVPSVVTEAGCVACVPHVPPIHTPPCEVQSVWVLKIWELSRAV